MVVAQYAAERWYIWIMQRPVEQITYVNGRAGVDIFFVISGFVMMLSLPSLEAKADPGWTFLRRRLIRIVPLYWFFTTLALLKLSLGMSVSGATTGSLWHVVASYLFIPTLGEGDAIVPVLSVGWTLQYEMLFYLLFALALGIGFAPLNFLLPTLFIIAGVGLFNEPSWPAALQGLVSPLVLKFLAGAILGRLTLRQRLPSPRIGAWLLVGGLVAILCVPGASLAVRVVGWGLPAAAIVLGCAALEAPLSLKLPRWLLELGNASYAVYLVHLFVLPLVWMAVRRVGGGGTAALTCILLTSLVATSLVGEAVHRWLELPLTSVLRGGRVRGVNTLPT